MSFLTRADVAAALREKGTGSALAGLRHAAKSDPSTVFDIFLSHSFHDTRTVAGIKTVLERLGLKVYVDWMDDAELDRSKVNRTTAARLRQRMRRSRSLVFATSESSPDSRWMPWELGYFDGHKPGHIAILPLVEDSRSSFVGQEYLSLYPVVESVGQLGAKRLAVRQSSGSWLPIVRLPQESIRRYV